MQKTTFFLLFYVLFFIAAEAKVSPQKTLTVSEVLQNGRYLQLNDGSFWQVHPESIPIAGSWILAPDVTVARSTDPIYTYKITNTVSQTTILAKKITEDQIQTPQPPTMNTQKKVAPPPSQQPQQKRSPTKEKPKKPTTQQ